MAVHPVDRHLFLTAAERVRPRERVRPSAWAERNIVLDDSQGERPGPIRMGYLPWMRTMHDMVFDRPGTIGEIWMCPAQVGKSTAMINKSLCAADTERGDVLYMLESDDKCRGFASGKFAPVIESGAGGRLKREVEKQIEQGRRAVMLSIPMGTGSKIDIASGASESATTSGSYRLVIIDEYEMTSDAISRRQTGSVWQSARKRTARWRFSGGISAFGHPRYADQGLHKLWWEVSDRGAWGFDSPCCNQFVSPRWRLVRYRAYREDGRPDPETAWLACPHCGAEISDAERQRRVWEPPDLLGGREGGTGRVESELAPEIARTREFAGLWIPGLCDPYRTVRGMARALLQATLQAEASGNDGPLLEWWNKDAGEPFEPLGSSDVTEESLSACTVEIIEPRVPEGIEIVTAGVDVQMPRESPTLYLTFGGWDVSGDLWILGKHRIKGLGTWSVYHRMLQESRWETTDGRVLGVLADAVDCAWETGQVLDQARVRLYSVAGGVIHRMAVRHEPKMSADLPMRFAPDAKRVKPGRPDLGQLDYRYLHRHTWCDRVYGLVSGKRYKLLCEQPADWRAHMTANVLRPVEQLHGQEIARMEWTKPEKYRDDWFQSDVYTAVAAEAHGDLSRLHLRRAARQIAESGRSGRGGVGVGFQVPTWE